MLIEIYMEQFYEKKDLPIDEEDIESFRIDI